MAQPLKLCGDAGAVASSKIFAAAKRAAVAIEVVAGGGRTPCGLAIPELQLPNGTTVRHTNAILRRIAQASECGLLGSSFTEEGQIDSWLEWVSLEVDHNELEGAEAVAPVCAALEAHLKSRTFLVGQRFTVADISAACSLRAPLEKAGLDKLRGTYPNAIRWLQTCVAHMEADGAPKAAPAKAAPKGKEAAPKAEAKAKAAPKAEAAPKAKAATAAPKAAAAPAAGGGGDAAAITAKGDEIRKLKEKLKAEGMSGKKIDASEDVKKLVAELVELKAAGPALPAAAVAAPAKAAKAEAPAPSPAAQSEESGANSAKNAEKKAKKDAEKAAKEAEKKKREDELQAARDAKTKGPDVRLTNFEDATFGNLFIQSELRTNRTWVDVADLTPARKDKEVWVRARVATSRKQGNKLCFLTLRQDVATVQAVAFGQEIAGFAGALPDESVVDILGTVTVPDVKIASCSQSEVELNVIKLFCIGRSTVLPLMLADASRSELDYEKDPTLVRVGQDIRLDNRVIDLRTVANQAIFRMQSGVCTLFREFLLQNTFQEIHTPKLIGGASEGGADVFRVDYFEGSAYLAQSPQLYKQMALMGGMSRVFEIGPIFRSEKSFTHRHMTEFTGMDIEMTFKDHYHEVLDMLDGVFNHIFTGLKTRFPREIEAVRAQYPFKDLQWKHPCKRFTFEEAVTLLREKGPALLKKRLAAEKDPYEKGLIEKHLEAVLAHDIEEDISTADEKVLGVLVHEELGEDLYIIDKFPKDCRPFYTMPDPADDRWTNAFDVFLRGEEITSGAQRIHDPKMLSEKAVALGVPVESIQSYIDAFKYGAYPHGGAGIGMERVVMLFMNLNNIRKTSMFPRDPKRLTP